MKWEKIKLQKIKEYIREVSKIVHEWSGHLEIFSLPRALENYTQFLLLRTDIFRHRKQSFGAPAVDILRQNGNLANTSFSQCF